MSSDHLDRDGIPLPDAPLEEPAGEVIAFHSSSRTRRPTAAIPYARRLLAARRQLGPGLADLEKILLPELARAPLVRRVPPLLQRA